MGTYESQYEHGKSEPGKRSATGASLLPPAPAKDAEKPKAVTGDRLQDAVSQRAMQVLATLPSSFQMYATRKSYPHVMNRIADAWHDPEFFSHVVRNLLIDQRGGRAGFEFSVLAEVTNLREYYFTTVHPEVRAKYDRDM